MNWIRLYLTVEGETELAFAKNTLLPHLSQYEVDLRPRMIKTNRKLGARGGALSFDRFKRDTAALMKQEAGRESRFSTLIDFYALPDTYPGWEEARKRSKPAERVLELEKALAREFDDPRFIPFLQLHEFEALLFCDLSQVQSRIPGSEGGIAALKQDIVGKSPEEINEGKTTAPSKRLIRYIPRYEKQKVRVGAPAAGAIGLHVLREKCPHFGQWLTQLENLKQAV